MDILIRVILSISLVAAPYALADAYVMRPGETVSSAYFEKFGKSLFRIADWENRFRKLNPDVPNPHRVYPGQEVHLDLENSEVRELASVETPAAPAPAPAPAPDFVPVSELGAAFGFEYFRIDSRDNLSGAKSTFLSTLSPQAHVNWNVKWSPKWTSTFKFQTIAQKIQTDERVATVTLEDATASRFGFQAGAERLWSDAHKTALTLGYKERVFAHAKSPGVLIIDRVGSPSVKLQHEARLLAVQNVSLGARANAEYILKGQGPGYSTKAGIGYEGSLFLRHRMKTFSITGEVYYGRIAQDSDLVEQSETHTGALLGLEWSFGP